MAEMNTRLLRSVLNAAYRRLRATDRAIDADLPVGGLVGFAYDKLLALSRGAVRGSPGSFVGRRVKIRGGSALRLGSSVSIGDDVEIVAFSRRGVVLGDNVTIDQRAALRATTVVRELGDGISIGDRSAIGAYNLLLGQGGVRIGSDCLLGPFVTIVSANHVFAETRVPIRLQGEERAEVVIGDDVWVGANVTILAGSRIGTGAVIAAGAVVRGHVQPYSIVGGVPARVIGARENRSRT